MNILLINHYAGGPSWGMEHRPYHLAREWVRQGHRVVIAAASYSHVRSQQPDVQEPVVETQVEGIRYRFYRTPAYRGNGFGRLENIRAFLAALRRDGVRLAAKEQPDAVIASSTYPFDVQVAKTIARASGAVLVFEVHDLWPLSLIEVAGLWRVHPFVLACGLAERAAYRDADVVVSMLPKVHEHMRRRGLDLSKLHIVPNGVSPQDWAHSPEALRDDVQRVIQQARDQGCTIVGYAGSMGGPNALEYLVAAAKILEHERFAFVLVGDGHHREALLQQVGRDGLGRFHLLPPIPKAQIPSFLRAIDIAYIGWRRQPLYRFGIAPNKLMDYMMAGCVVLHSVEAGNDPVREADCGLSVEPENPAAIARGLRQLALIEDAFEREVMGQRGREFVEARHSYPVLAQTFLEAVQQARARRSTASTRLGRGSR